MRPETEDDAMQQAFDRWCTLLPTLVILELVVVGLVFFL